MDLPYKLLMELSQSGAGGVLFGGRPQGSGSGRRPGARNRIVATLQDAGFLPKSEPNPTDAEILAATDAAKAAAAASGEEAAYLKAYPAHGGHVPTAADAAAEAEYRKFYPKP